MPPKKKVAKRVTKMKQKVKVVQQVVVNIGGKRVSKRKKSTRVGKKESKPTYVQVPLIVPSQTFQPSTVAFSSPDMINSALKTDNTRQQDLIKIKPDVYTDNKVKIAELIERSKKYMDRKEMETGQVSEASKLLSRRIDKQREDMRLAMIDD